MSTKIDLSKIRNEDGTYSEGDLKAIEKVTGKSLTELIEEQKKNEGSEFTREQIGAMSSEEYKENRKAINKALSEGRIK